MAHNDAEVELSDGQNRREGRSLLSPEDETEWEELLEKEAPRHISRGIVVGILLSVLALLCVGIIVVVLYFIFRAPDPVLHFLVIGDWGRDGQKNQTFVANAMGRRGDSVQPRFVISVGDNFYESGLTSAEDKQFDTSFKDIYTASSLQVPWYAVLGNHDYGEYYDDTKDLKPCNTNDHGCYLSPLHQFNKTLTERDGRWQCQRWYELDLPEHDAQIFFIDTNPMILEYHDEPWADAPGGIKEQSWESQILELEARLAASTALWKLVIGHHPVRNQHLPYNTPELMEHLEPILLQQGVQAYFSGHEHNLQYIHEDSTRLHYIVSGGGSLSNYSGAHWDNGGAKWFWQGSGFVSCELKSKALKCEFIGLDNEDLLSVDIPR